MGHFQKDDFQNCLAARALTKASGGLGCLGYAESIKLVFLHSRVFMPWKTNGSLTKYVL